MSSITFQGSNANISHGTADLGALRAYGVRGSCEPMKLFRVEFAAVVEAICYGYGVDVQERATFVVALANWLLDHLDDPALRGRLVYGGWSYNMECLVNVPGFSARQFVATVAIAVCAHGGLSHLLAN